ncbi:hypothetical protein MMC08_002273 [Hypocenomyce scalaris]|nr:hypothetical protein [Hypocenomyce scalaris]
MATSCSSAGSFAVDLLRMIVLTVTLLGLCRRRQWPDPLYEIYGANVGFTCIVRVNNREYQTDTIYENEMLARENAAMRAYLICRNFSVNDGMYPSGNRHGAVMQGLPVAIGTERRSIYSEDLDTSASSGSRSGGSSPRSYDSGKMHINGRRGSGISRALTSSNRHH